MSNLMRFENLGIEIDVCSFDKDYREKNIQFFKLLDKAVNDNNIEVIHTTKKEDESYYLMVAVITTKDEEKIFNCLPKAIFKKYINDEQILKIFPNWKKLKMEHSEFKKIIASYRKDNFLYIKKAEDKAKIIAKLIKFTDGKFKKSQYYKIATEIMGFIDKNEMQTSFEILKTYDIKEFAKELTLKNYKFSHSWAGDTFTKEDWIYIYTSGDADDIIFGEDGSYEYSNNGNCEDGSEWENECNFNVNEIYLIIKNYEDFSNFNNNYYDEKKTTIVIYIPDKEYKNELEPEIEYIMYNFNL